MLPDINRFWSDPDQAWTIYMAMMELCKALACLYLVRNVFGNVAAVWFLSQAYSEARNGNAWPQDGWEEYLAFCVLCASAVAYYVYHKPGW